MSNSNRFKSEVAYIECICPTCGIKHKYRMFWTGTCTPRKYCKEHIKKLKSTNILDPVIDFGGRVPVHKPDQASHPYS